MIQAVNKHQGLLRASVANIGQDHRLGANEAPPAIISIFLGAELEKVFEAISTGEGDPNTPASFLDLGSSVLPPLPLDGGDRNRTSPFAFTGNKFEFRALGSSMSLAFPNTVLNTIAAEAIDDLAGKLKEKLDAGSAMPEAVMEIVKDSYLANKVVCFGGDNYSEEWHEEAEKRGLKNLKTTPDALPEVLADDTVKAFEDYNVLSKRELESRYDVWVEQYAIRANIEAEETFSIGQTMILPAGLRQLSLISEAGVSSLEGEVRELVDDLVGTLGELKEANVGARRPRGARPRDLRPRQPAGVDGQGARGGRQAGEGRRRRLLAAAEVRGDALHQVARGARQDSGPSCPSSLRSGGGT